MTTYLAGPMTGIPDFNFPAFAAAAAKLRADNHTVISPHELHDHTDREWCWYIREALKALLDCDEIVLLPYWEASRGARLEHDDIAVTLGMKVTYL